MMHNRDWLKLGGMLIGLSFCGSVAAAPLAVGTPAPNFTLKSDSGKNYKLSELQGKVVLLVFWATWCSPCRQQLPTITPLSKQFADAGLRVFGINIDKDRNTAANAARQMAVGFPTLFDNDKRVSKLFQLDDIPTLFILGRDGVVRQVRANYKPGDEQSYSDDIRSMLAE